MSYFALMTMALGVILSSASGLICYAGDCMAFRYVDWVPSSDLLFLHPAASLGIGAVLMVLGIAMHPNRVQ